jgi:DNA-binding NtrC family response regulator
MKTVLVVDDCQDTTDLYGIILMGKGYKVLTANNMQKAVEHAYTNKVDLLLTDLYLGDGMGSELAYLMGKRVPKSSILITGREEMPSAKFKDFDDYLLKPVDPDTLCKTVDACLKLHQPEETEALTM